MIQAGDYLRLARQLPTVGLADLTRGRGLVVIAPHPDDESLGCGGLIAAACEHGLQVRIVLVSDGTGSHPNSTLYPPARLRALREQELVESAAILGLPATAITCLGLPDREVPTTGPSFDAAVQEVRRVAEEVGAGSVFAPWRHDPHCDHQAAFAIARAAAAGLTDVRLHAYPVWGWDLAPDTMLDEAEPRGGRLDIRPYVDRKRRAIAAHRSQTTDLITDDPDGFRLDPAMVARFHATSELFLEVAS
jgi:LmbE family N-acetylglucosaminyl deacetylase